MPIRASEAARRQVTFLGGPLRGGLAQRATYEGQAASALEWAADNGPGDQSYDFPLCAAREDGCLTVDWQPALVAALADLGARRPVAIVCSALHRGLAAAIAAVAQQVGEARVALTGGCFQNGIALGQAAWAGWSDQSGDA